MCVSCFNFVGLTEKCDKEFNVLDFERKKIEEIKEYINTGSLIQVYMLHQPTVHVWTKFQLCVPLCPWEKRDEIFYTWKLERKKNEEIKGRISRRNLVLFHIKQQMIHNNLPNYKILHAIVHEKYLSQISLCITLEWEMEKRRKKAK